MSTVYMTRNSDVNYMLGLFLGVSPSLRPVIIPLSYFALGEFQKLYNDTICLLLAKHLQPLFCLFNMQMNSRRKEFD